jgi:hypothetical protein
MLTPRLLGPAFGLLVLCAGSLAQAQMLSIDGGKSDSKLQTKPNDPQAVRQDPGQQKPHALALRARWVTVPGWSLAPYTDAHTQLNDGWSLAAEYIYLMPKFDVVVSLDYSWLNPANGNYLGKGNNAGNDTHFLAFDKLSSLSIDVSLIGHWNLTNWMEIRFGAGLGLGVVFGNIYQINSNQRCTLGNVNDLGTCYPDTFAYKGTNYDVHNPYPEQTPSSLYCNPDLSDSTADTAQTPCLRRIETYPMTGRVVPVLNVLLGFRFRAHRNVYIHLETGWRLVGFYLGAGPEFRF